MSDHHDFIVWLRSVGVTFVDTRRWWVTDKSIHAVQDCEFVKNPADLAEVGTGDLADREFCMACRSNVLGHKNAFQEAHMLRKAIQWFDELLRADRPRMRPDSAPYAVIDAERAHFVIGYVNTIRGFWGDADCLAPLRALVDERVAELQQRFPDKPGQLRDAAIHLAAVALVREHVRSYDDFVLDPDLRQAQRAAAATWLEMVDCGRSTHDATEATLAQVTDELLVDAVKGYLAGLEAAYAEALTDDDEVFFAVTGISDTIYTVPQISAEVVVRRAIRARVHAAASGSLPRVVVRWLSELNARNQFKVFEVPVPYRDVDTETYRSALQLWSENRGSDGPFSAVPAAFQAALLL